MIPALRLPPEDWYIRNMYRFYFLTGLLHFYSSSLILLDLIGLYQFDYDNFYEVSYISFIMIVVYMAIPLLFFLPFVIKLMRYARKNLWLSLPFSLWIFMFLFISLSEYQQIFRVFAFLFFISYSFVAIASGLHGIKLIKRYDDLKLNRD